MEVDTGSALPLQTNTPGSQDDLVHLSNSEGSIQETACLVENVPRNDELDAEEEMLGNKPGDSVSRAATPSEELERDLLGETDSSTMGNDNEIGGDAEGESDSHIGLPQELCAAKNLDCGGDTRNGAFGSLGTAVSIVAESTCSEVSSAEIVQGVETQERTKSVQLDSPNVSVVGDDTTLDRVGRLSAVDEQCDTSMESDGDTVDVALGGTNVDLHDSVVKDTDVSLQESSANVEQVEESKVDYCDDRISRSEDSFNNIDNLESKADESTAAVVARSDVLDDSTVSATEENEGNRSKTPTPEGGQNSGAADSNLKDQIAKEREEGESGALEDVEMAPNIDEPMELMDCEDEDPFAAGEKAGDHDAIETSEREKVGDDEKEIGDKIQEMEEVAEDKDKETDTGKESSDMVQVVETEKLVESTDTSSVQDVLDVLILEQTKVVEGNEDKVEEQSDSQITSNMTDGKENSTASVNDSTVVPVSPAGRRKRSTSGHNGAHPAKLAKSGTDSNVETVEVEISPGVICSDDGTMNSEANKNDEEICIIPDDVPRVMPTMLVRKVPPTVISMNRKTNVVTKVKLDATKTTDKTNHVGGRSSESRRAPSRPQRQAAKKAESQIKELAQEESNSNEGFTDQPEDTDVMENDNETPQMCIHCCRVRSCKYRVYIAGKLQFLCQDSCSSTFRKSRTPRVPTEPIGSRSLVRKCGQCCILVTPQNEKTLSWETMDFCNEECLEKYQKQLGSHCANCKGPVQPTSLGKYCVRFGYDIKQFCCSSCLEEFKKGLKVCSYCQKDISGGAEGFLAPVGEKGQFKDFCTQSCMLKYNQMSNNQTPPPVKARCAVCNDEKIVKIEVLHGLKTNKLCSEPCFAAYKFVNSVSADQCDMCKKYFDKREIDNFSVFYDDAPHNFCCKTCMNVYILANRKIVPCTWCKVKKYNFDMIKRVTAAGQCLMMCSLSCLKLYSVSMSAVSNKKVKCDMCSVVAPAQYHLTMSDLSIRNFCNYSCVMQFQGNKPGGNAAMPVISAVQSLATTNGKPAPVPNSGANSTRASVLKANNSTVPTTPVQGQQIVPPPVTSPASSLVKQQVIVKPPVPKLMCNKGVSCKPYMHTKGVGCRPHPLNKDTQTDDSLGKPVLIPVPVPIYVPAPMHMYSNPFPVPVPFPLPVPVPIFVPTTRNSAQGIMKEIKKIQEKIPTDPFEAELLMMAEMVAGEKKPDLSDSESDEGANDAGDASEVAVVEGVASAAEGGFSPEAVDTSNTFGEDMLQMALKMASELEEPAVDLEAALTPSTITAQSNPSMEQNDESEDDPEPAQNLSEQRPTSGRGRKRSMRSTARGGSGGGTPSKRGRRISSSVDIPLLPPPEPAQPARIEQEKPDANMCLKYTFGVNAWRHWVQTKNAELEKAATNNRKLKLFKPEILQLTADELNYSLCLFVKEVRKPNGQEYAPDTIYYLCLGIQQYLFENGRIDNIFTDSYYEKFTECLDEVARKFTALYNDSQFIVTRVEEEHLWESKQLGAHSPHVLLSTLLFFNTKHFNLTTVDEHMQLSFSHIMKHWKRNPNQPNVNKVTGSSRNVLLRFYPPQSALDGNSKKKKLYEQLENEENPLRCPVKLYEFYLSKCPESVKTRNDVFYLLPERSCVPDSPVWYSTMALGREPLLKMLHRVKMVKEINMALLSS